RPGPPARRDSDHHGAVTLLLLIAALQADSASVASRDFPFASGETLPVLRLHYLTLGRLRRDAGGSARNAVLILHGTGGSGSQFLSPLFAGELYGPGQPLDTTTHYLILPDNLGHGRSSKPSDGLKARFPHYTYGDMVAAQYRLVTDGLHVDHLLLVMGTSMGCMHSWLWAERHPDFMDGVVPLACAPTQIAGRNRMMRRMIIEDIRGDPDWRGGTYSQQPRGLLAALQLLFMMSSSPLQLQRTAPTRDSADAYITRWLRERLAETDANDMAYQFEASRDYDPRPDLERITDPAFAAQTRFKALVVQGGLTTGLLHALVAMDLPGPGTVFLSQNWKFTAPVYIGDTITAEAEVVSVHDTKPVCRLKVTVTRQTGETVLEGEAWCYTFSA